MNVKCIFITLLLVLTCSVSMGQDSTLVKGKIIGINNQPIKDVSISVEGIYMKPAITGEDGNFEIKVSSGDEQIIVTPAGNYKGKRIYLNRRNQLTIKLTPVDLNSGYDEIINLYRSDARRNFISSFNSVNPANAISKPNVSIDQLFQGTVPGFFLTGHSGMPGSGTTSYMRGIKSMYTNNQPLYIVDGFPIEAPGLFNSNLDGYIDNPLANLDPFDITNITILKDYLATASYGMRASNGVILVETLKPSEVRTNIEFAYRTGITIQPRQIPQLNNRQYKSFANEMLFTSGISEEEAQEDYYPIFSTPADKDHYLFDHNTNWQDRIYSEGPMNDFYLRVRGGDEIARYGLSVGYMNHKGIIENTSFDRFNVRFVGTFNIFQWLRMYVNSNLNTNFSELRESAKIYETSPILTSLFKAPILNPFEYDSEGQELLSLAGVGPLGVSNPQAIVDKFEAGVRNYHFASSIRIEGDITEQLKWNSYLGLDYHSTNESVFMPNTGMELYYSGEAYNVSKSLKNYLNSLYTDNYISYSQKLGANHSLGLNAGLRVQMNKFQVDWGIGKNSHERDEYKQLQNGTNFLREMGGENASWNRLTLYGTANYSFKDRYLLQGSLLSDYSSRIGDNAQDVIHLGGHPFGLFYSVGGAWRISDEAFLKDIYWLEDLKLRLTYGVTGNDYVGNYSALNYYTTVHYRETTGMVPGPINDETVKYEVNRQMNGGIDIGLFANTVNMTFDLFNITTEDLLVFEPQPNFTGFSIIPANNGEILNKGFETSLFARLISIGRFKWDLGINYSRFHNTVESIKNDEVVTSFDGGQFITRVGEPIISFYGYEYEGVFSSSEEALQAGLANSSGIPFEAGDAKFNDVSGPSGLPDGVINDYDKVIIGSPVPDYHGGISTRITFGKWSVESFLQFVMGNEVFNYLRYRNECMTDLSNQSTNVLKRWFYEGQETDVPRALWRDPVGNSDFSSRWIEDGSYIRLKNVTVTYTVPDKVFFMRNLQVFGTITNLYTWTRYLGYDPEFSYSYHTMEQGIDYGMMPHTRKFMIGVKIGL